MYSYLAFGLGIHSEFPIPEFLPALVEADVVVRFASLAEFSEEERERLPFFSIMKGKMVIPVEHVAIFLVRRGSEILVFPAANYDERQLRRYIVGNIMGALLYQRGLVALHASAVSLNGSAIAFSGVPGKGKSSIAGALLARGWNVVTDDVLAIDVSAMGVLVRPSFPQIKLTLESAHSLGYDPAVFAPVERLEDKCSYRLSERGFSSKPVALKSIYMLADHLNMPIQRVPASEAVIELTRHAFPTRFAQPGDPAHFGRCVKIANQVAMYRLRRSDSVEELSEWARTVEEHVGVGLALGTA